MRQRVVALNEHRRARTAPMTNEEKRMRIAAAHKANPNASDREIARDAGVDHKTVGAARKEVLTVGNFPTVNTDTKVATKKERILAEFAGRMWSAPH